MNVTPNVAASALVPLHLDYATAVEGSVPDGVTTFDQERQVTLFDGVPFSKTDPGIRSQVTTSNIRSDGVQGAIDAGQPDDATPNA
ncbi:hypothetical protein [Streptodolium elevatio]|uniref:Uncharacterized protein n=1 Tax=Streptodolium elevatio TaxID=3157996 RepID=A0ABV3DVC9_9ACTN